MFIILNIVYVALNNIIEYINTVCNNELNGNNAYI